MPRVGTSCVPSCRIGESASPPVYRTGPNAPLPISCCVLEVNEMRRVPSGPSQPHPASALLLPRILCILLLCIRSLALPLLSSKRLPLRVSVMLNTFISLRVPALLLHVPMPVDRFRAATKAVICFFLVFSISSPYCTGIASCVYRPREFISSASQHPLPRIAVQFPIAS